MAGQINLNSKLGQLIEKIAQQPNVHTFIDVGTWNGQGSTRCLVEGLKKRTDRDLCQIFSIEANKKLYNVAQQFWKPLNITFLKLLYGRIAEKMMSQQEILAHPDFLRVKTHYELHYQQDVIDFREAPEITQQLPKIIDVVILDGGEFCSYYDWIVLKKYNPKIVILDDTDVIKNKQVVIDLINEGWRNTIQSHERNGFCIFEKC